MSVATTIPYESDEDEIDYIPEPILILSGEGEPEEYHIMPWEDELDERVPTKSCYINVVHR
jgi:hypothetical protein